MTPTHVLLSDGRSVYTWQYRTALPPAGGASAAKGAAGVAGALQDAGAGMRKGGGRERMLDIDDPSPTPAQVRHATHSVWDGEECALKGVIRGLQGSCRAMGEGQARLPYIMQARPHWFHLRTDCLTIGGMMTDRAWRATSCAGRAATTPSRPSGRRTRPWPWAGAADTSTSTAYRPSGKPQPTFFLESEDGNP